MPDLYTLPNASAGIDTIFIQLVAEVPAFVPLMLLFVFFVVFIGGTVRQLTKHGYADYSTWATIASISIFILSLLMTLVSGLIRLEWLVIVTVITIFSGVWLFLDNRGGGV